MTEWLSESEGEKWSLRHFSLMTAVCLLIYNALSHSFSLFLCRCNFFTLVLPHLLFPFDEWLYYNYTSLTFIVTLIFLRRQREHFVFSCYGLRKRVRVEKIATLVKIKDFLSFTLLSRCFYFSLSLFLSRSLHCFNIIRVHEAIRIRCKEQHWWKKQQLQDTASESLLSCLWGKHKKTGVSW